MKKFRTAVLTLITISTILGLRPDVKAQESSEIFTIYLVRHSEKDVTGNHAGDPPLTECGAERSEHLSTFLSAVPIDAVYSTNYTRTKNTALPTAQSKKIEIQEYNPGELEAVSDLLLEKKEDALVVGHSNTTAVLAGILTNQELGSFDESIYNRIYQVVVQERKGRLHLFHTSFACKDR